MTFAPLGNLELPALCSRPAGGRRRRRSGWAMLATAALLMSGCGDSTGESAGIGSGSDGSNSTSIETTPPTETPPPTEASDLASETTTPPPQTEPTAAPTTVPAPACGNTVEEAYDPTSIQHVLPGAAEPEFRADPPTSGPHQPGPPREGVLAETLSKPLQVGVLESGGVIMHHNGLLAADEVAALTELAVDSVALMENPAVGDNEVVVTAWLHRLECETVDVDAIAAFVNEFRNAAEDDH